MSSPARVTNRPSSWSSVSNRRAPGRERSAHNRRWAAGNRHAAAHDKTQRRMLNPCPHATDVRGSHAWLKAGRVVRTGQKGVTIVAPVMGGDDGGKVVNIKPEYVFDVTQTDERTPRAPAA